MEPVAGRIYVPRTYRVTRRTASFDLLIRALEASGARVIYNSLDHRPSNVPIYLGIEASSDERFGVLCYPFTATRKTTRNRPTDENRIQIRYEREELFHDEHPLGRDVAGIDVTIVLGVHVEHNVLLGLDPAAYDPLPMGISIEFKDADVELAQHASWHVWQRENHGGKRREASRTAEGFETVIAFTPQRLIDYVRFERQASGLGLDPALRYTLAESWANAATPHPLEVQFDLSATEILDVIAERFRLGVATRGGVAERHLERALEQDASVAEVTQVDRDGAPDFDVLSKSGQRLQIECKNASPNRARDGLIKVEVQKTRSQKQDEAGRFYPADHFDVLAVCLFPVTGIWEFRYCRASTLTEHTKHPGRLAAIQRVDPHWPNSLAGLLGST
jgi:hypothetical protein